MAAPVEDALPRPRILGMASRDTCGPHGAGEELHYPDRIDVVDAAVAEAAAVKPRRRAKDHARPGPR